MLAAPISKQEAPPCVGSPPSPRWSCWPGRRPARIPRAWERRPLAPPTVLTLPTVRRRTWRPPGIGRAAGTTTTRRLAATITGAATARRTTARTTTVTTTASDGAASGVPSSAVSPLGGRHRTAFLGRAARPRRARRKAGPSGPGADHGPDKLRRVVTRLPRGRRGVLPAPCSVPRGVRGGAVRRVVEVRRRTPVRLAPLGPRLGADPSAPGRHVRVRGSGPPALARRLRQAPRALHSLAVPAPWRSWSSRKPPNSAWSV